MKVSAFGCYSVNWRLNNVYMYVCRYVFKKLRGNLKGKLCPDPFLKKKLYNRYLNDKLSKKQKGRKEINFPRENLTKCTNQVCRIAFLRVVDQRED